jgi:hypothetical protein
VVTAPSDNTVVKILKDFPHAAPGEWIAEMEYRRGSAADAPASDYMLVWIDPYLLVVPLLLTAG